MIWGQQWDAMVSFIGDKANSEILEFQSDVSNSGTATYKNNKKDIIKNIYDLRGNVREWTPECDSKGRIIRGGLAKEGQVTLSYMDTIGPSYFIKGNSNYHGSRLALYIK